MELSGVALLVSLAVESYRDFRAEDASFFTVDEIPVPLFGSLEIRTSNNTVFLKHDEVMSLEEVQRSLLRFTPIEPDRSSEDPRQVIAEAFENTLIAPQFWIRVWGDIVVETGGDVVYDAKRPQAPDDPHPSIKRLSKWCYAVRAAKIELEPTIEECGLESDAEPE
ncbi:MAG: hypothetical protein HY567_00630 [Candidatus Kerfeldbacteria bacterium]|nr:hypothetical protein [Candidatus Kerfeldbacteria bacterium]